MINRWDVWVNGALYYEAADEALVQLVLTNGWGRWNNQVDYVVRIEPCKPLAKVIPLPTSRKYYEATLYSLEATA